MKNSFALAVLTFFVIHAAFAQSNSDTVKNSNAVYKSILDSLIFCDTASVELEDESTEGAEAIAYYQGKNIKLIDANHYGETGRKQIQYFFNNGELFFTIEKELRSNRPIYYTEEMAQENAGTESFDPGKTIVTTVKYYFNSGKLIRLLDNDNKEPEGSLAKNSGAGIKIISDAAVLKQKFEN